MSYILEALKKSEQERQKDRVPDISSLHEASEPDRGGRGPGPWLIGGTILVILAGAGMLLLTNDQSPIEIPAPPPLRAPGRLIQARAPIRATVPTRVARKKPPAPAMTKKTAAPQPHPARTPVAHDRARESIPNLADLPPAERDRFPHLAIAAHFYSANPASRMVSINGRLFRQGDEVEPGLVVAEITRKGVIFSSGTGRFFLPVY